MGNNNNRVTGHEEKNTAGRQKGTHERRKIRLLGCYNLNTKNMRGVLYDCIHICHYNLTHCCVFVYVRFCAWVSTSVEIYITNSEQLRWMLLYFYYKVLR